MDYVSVTRMSLKVFASRVAAASLVCAPLLTGCSFEWLFLAPVAVPVLVYQELTGVTQEGRSPWELSDKQIGHQSIPVTIPQIGKLRLLAFPLNASERRGREPFVICLAPRWAGTEPTEKPKSLSIDAKLISLILPNGSAIKPSGYVVDPICPYVELQTSTSRTLAFLEIDFGKPIFWDYSLYISWGFPDLALRFDVVAPEADAKFLLKLGSIALDGAQHDLPTIEFASHYGGFGRTKN